MKVSCEEEAEPEVWHGGGPDITRGRAVWGRAARFHIKLKNRESCWSGQKRVADNSKKQTRQN